MIKQAVTRAASAALGVAIMDWEGKATGTPGIGFVVACCLLFWAILPHTRRSDPQ